MRRQEQAEARREKLRQAYLRKLLEKQKAASNMEQTWIESDDNIFPEVGIDLPDQSFPIYPNAIILELNVYFNLWTLALYTNTYLILYSVVMFYMK